MPTPLSSTEKNILSQILARVDAMDRAIRGDNGELGLVAEVRAIKAKDLLCPIKSVSKTLWGDPDMEGYKAKGLVDLVEEHEEFVQNIKKFKTSMTITAGTTVVAAIINILLSFLLNAP